MNTINGRRYTLSCLNGLLRGELAAVETCGQALSVINGERGAEVRRIREEHRDATARLHDEVRRAGGQPDRTSGLWGTFAMVFEGAARLFGDSAALGGLLRGEERGATDYASALQDPRLPEEVKALVRDHLLPRAREHFQTLKGLLSTPGGKKKVFVGGAAPGCEKA